MNEKSRDDLRAMLERHVQHTGSTVAQRILDNWDVEIEKFVRVMPRDYARVLREQAQQFAPRESEVLELQHAQK